VAVKGGREWSPKARTENLPDGGFRRRLSQYPYFTAQLLQHSPHDRSESRSLGLVSAASALAAALLGLCLYAAFAHGAVAAGDEERLQLAIAVVAAVSAVAWLWSGTLAIAAPVAGWIALGLLAAFAFWSGLTLLWSVAPDQTWIECNRAITYVIVLGLAIGLGASHRRAPRLIADGFALVALLVSAYAVGQKLLPGIRIAGVLSLDRTGTLPRLQDPLGYWNALGAFVAMGIAIVLSVVLDVKRPRRLRLAGSVATLVMLVTIGFTYSRGAVLALAVAVGIVVFGSRGRLRALLWLGICLAAAVPVTVIGLASAPLTAAGAGLGSRERAGAELLVLLIASGLLLVLGARRLLALEARMTLAPARRRAVARGLVATGATLALVGIAVVGLSARGLGGTASHLWDSFTTTHTSGVYDPARLVSADSENRWGWWKEAAGAISARPVQGWGAGSFGVTHLLYRRDILSVQQPHSVPLQFLAETGIVGAALALGCLILLLTTAVRAVRRAGGRTRPAAMGLLAAAVAYAVHSLYDWDWDIPALTIPALVFLGTLVGSLGPRPDAVARSAPRRVARASACAVASVFLTLFAVSAVAPRLAASDADQALVAASGSGRPELRLALARALTSSRLDPVSDAGLRAASTIALRIGRAQTAQRLLASAVGRQPTDGQAWQQLTLVYLVLGDRRDAILAARRGLALDPRAPLAATVAQRTVLALTPPPGSATSVPTVPAGPG
jgi:O-antigen ligase/polysaccharide polymerase Wzy-like membrane protein